LTNGPGTALRESRAHGSGRPLSSGVRGKEALARRRCEEGPLHEIFVAVADPIGEISGLPLSVVCYADVDQAGVSGLRQNRGWGEVTESWPAGTFV